jgi:hypothetical protein
MQTINPYKLNVVDGDVRFRTLSDPDWGDVLAGVDMEGVVTKVRTGSDLYIDQGTLYAVPNIPAKRFSRYLATLTQTGTGDPEVTILENTFGGTFTWTRNSAGNYTLTSEFDSFYAYPLMYSHPSDVSGNALFSRLYRTSGNTATLIVKDGSMTNIDGWSQITVEIKVYLLG